MSSIKRWLTTENYRFFGMNVVNREVAMKNCCFQVGRCSTALILDPWSGADLIREFLMFIFGSLDGSSWSSRARFICLSATYPSQLPPLRSSLKCLRRLEDPHADVMQIKRFAKRYNRLIGILKVYKIIYAICQEVKMTTPSASSFYFSTDLFAFQFFSQ